MRKAPFHGTPLSSCLKSPLAVQSCTRSSSLLPFLYQTRTVLLESKIARSVPGGNNHDGQKRTFCSTFKWNAPAEKLWRHDPDPRQQRIIDNISNTGSRPSTVTATEQEVFNRLIKAIPQSTVPEPDYGDILGPDEQVSEDYDPYVDLHKIFESAIQQVQLRKESASKRASQRRGVASLTKQQPVDAPLPDGDPALRARAYKRALKWTDRYDWVDAHEFYEGRQTLEVACDDHRTMILRMLDDANSDLEIWRVLENEVFHLITQLDEHNALVRKAENNKALQAAKARIAKAQSIDIADVKLTKADLSYGEAKNLSLNPRTPSLPINHVLSILDRNYSDYCLQALRLFRQQYPTSPYAPHVLAAMKARGPISYVLGASTDIYNEVLFLRWTQYSDLHGVCDLLEEMHKQGVEVDGATVALVKGIHLQRRAAYSGHPAVQQWWFTRRNVEGLKRMFGILPRVVRSRVDDETEGSEDGDSEDGEGGESVFRVTDPDERRTAE